MRIAAVLLAFCAAAAASADTLSGTVVAESAPLPGCTVTLTSADLSRTAVTDVDGRYRFTAVPAGRYDLEFELPGFETAEQRVHVNGESTAPPQALRIGAEVISFSCGMATCDQEPPRSRFDRPLCSEEELNTLAIEAVERGDNSALDLALRRYQAADTYQERHRLAAALLGRLPNDRAIWNELAEEAALAVRYPHTAGHVSSPEFEAYCLERAADPDSLWSLSVDALYTAAKDPRSRTLLLDALKTGDECLLPIAVAALAERKDVAALPRIADVLGRLEQESTWIALALAAFESEEADALALKYLSEEERTDYLAARRPQQQ